MQLDSKTKSVESISGKTAKLKESFYDLRSCAFRVFFGLFVESGESNRILEK